MADINGTASDDTLQGTGNEDRLNGYLGADKMAGGANADIYYVDNAGDLTIETANKTSSDAIDLVYASISATLAANIEYLVLIGGAQNGTGNAIGNGVAGNFLANKLDGGAGDDYLFGYGGDDNLIGGAGNDVLRGGSGNDIMAGGTGADEYEIDSIADKINESANQGIDTIYSDLNIDLGSYQNVENFQMGDASVAGKGNDLDNTMYGNDAANTIDGGLGNDLIYGFGDDDTLNGDAGNDQLYGGDYNDILNGGAGNDVVDGGDGNDKLVGGDGNDILKGGVGDNELTGGKGNDVYIIDFFGGKNTVTESKDGGIDEIRSATGIDLSAAGFENIENATSISKDERGVFGNNLDNVLTGSDSKNTLVGGGGNDILIGGLGDDDLVGGLGHDVLIGGRDNDTYHLDDAFDKIVEKAGEGSNDSVTLHFDNYTLADEVETLRLSTGAINAAGNKLDNNIFANGVANIMAGGAGNDNYFDFSADDKVVELANGGMDTIYTQVTVIDLSNVNFANIENVSFVDLMGGATLTGNVLNNILKGGLGDDTLSGGLGNDTLVGGKGVNQLTGGLGNDIYILADTDSTDTITENIGEGIDEIRTGRTTIVDISLVGLTQIENITLIGASGLAAGNDLDNKIVGTAGNDEIGGGGGKDIIEGAAGNDDLHGNAGDDKLNGGDNDDQLAGDAGNDILTGGAGNDDLFGGTGNDSLTGGNGDDKYHIDNSKDKVIEAAKGGSYDTVYSTLTTYTLASNVENLILDGAQSINGTGNALNNQISGNGGNNNISGGAGNDSIEDAGGNDTLDGGSGNDVLFGGAGNDRLIGGAGNDILEGAAGADTLEGGAGNDTYRYVDADDKIVETATGGIDTFETEAASIDLGNFANVENAIYLGTSFVTIAGNNLNNKLSGGAGDDALNGGIGNDDLIGGVGNDALTGGDGNDILNGGDGVDTLKGGKGNDVYFVDMLDSIEELDGEGIDEIRSATTINLATANGNNVENATLTGSDFVGATGNSLDNLISGNEGENVLLGGDGNDTLFGGEGNDVLGGDKGADAMFGGRGDDSYDIDDKGDKVGEKTGEGHDTVVSHIESYVLSDNIEDLVLSTNALNGTGNKLDNTITANGVANTMAGGAGNDSYLDVGSNDTVVEAANGGIDTIHAIADFFSLADIANVENLTYTGTNSSDLTGNALNNVLTGGNLGDKLRGGLGNDILYGLMGINELIGGKGNDVYVLADKGSVDTVTELTNEGIDAIHTGRSIGVDLTAAGFVDIENVTLTGAMSIDATGNDLDNCLTGNEGENTLLGGKGDDTLAGGADSDTLNGGEGIDKMLGGAGADIYVVDNFKDSVIEFAAEGFDIVESRIDNYTLTANVEELDLVDAALNGTGNALDNFIFGNDQNNKLDGSSGNDSLHGGNGNDTLIGGTGNDELAGQDGNDIMTGGGGNDTYYVESDGDQVIETAGGGVDTIVTDLNNFTLAANVENLVLYGSGQQALGNDLNNVITGGDDFDDIAGGKGNDTLFGGEGNDLLIGDDFNIQFSGDDVLEGGLGADTLAGGKGSDLYLYRLDDTADLAMLGDDKIVGFETGKDKIDLFDLFDSFGIATNDAVADGYLKIMVNGAGSQVLFDSDGGGNSFVLLATVQNAAIFRSDIVIPEGEGIVS